MASIIIAALFLLGTTTQILQSVHANKEIIAEKGSKVLLPCPLKFSECGNPKSIKWYRGASTIFKYDDTDGLLEGNDDISPKSNIDYTPESNESFLKIGEIGIRDDGYYLCETKYSSDDPDCDEDQVVLLNVTARPEFIRIIEGVKDPLEAGSKIGPVNEGSDVSLSCISGEGKPPPKIEWFRNDEVIQASSESTIDMDGVGNGSSLLDISISRKDLNSKIICKATNAALKEPLTIQVDLDVHVRPLKLEISGVVGHVVKGTKILLQCTASSARPAADVFWYNGTEALSANSERLELFETKLVNNNDTSISTLSYLAFTASEYDNGKTFNCEAKNAVTEIEDLKPMKDSSTIVVLYPPIVKMESGNKTVNETDDFIIICDYEANPAALKGVKWLLNDEELILEEDHYEGGTTEQPDLTVKNATGNDTGSYRCLLENSVNASLADSEVFVSVIFRPTVKVSMHPEGTIYEDDKVNVSLSCDVIDGNPEYLEYVRWFLDGDLLKELPDCDGDPEIDGSTKFCGIDPSKLLLESVGRSFHGNYSCSGKNAAGWGPISVDSPLDVYYRPGPAVMTQEPEVVIKNEGVNLTCSIVDPGRPEEISFVWFRDTDLVEEGKDGLLSIESAGLDTEANFTCFAQNEAGNGTSATTFIEVSVAPEFIKPLDEYSGYVYNATNVNISCWVECSPICTISWLRNDEFLNPKDNDRYYIVNVYHEVDRDKKIFESVESTLVWNLTAWPNNRLVQSEDNVKFTCESSHNSIGRGVNSSTVFHVEYPPENIRVSKERIDVIVDNLAESVTCKATAHPTAEYKWIREGTDEVAIEGPIFDFNVTVPRQSNGTYYCVASNKHGSQNISVVLNVMFKPECRVETESTEEEDYIVCSAIANPEEVDFKWSLEASNETTEVSTAKDRDGKSYILIEPFNDNAEIYKCVVNNSIGISETCEINLSKTFFWWHWFTENFLLLIIIITVIIVVLLIICIIICVVCKRKRSKIKLANNNEMEFGSDASPQSGPQKTFYENLPFHGIQSPPNKPFKTEFSDLDYADVDYRSYGPINYKAASIDLLKQRQAQQRQLQAAQERRPQMYGVTDDNEELL
ncbi:hemicentin-1 isoform X2 [Prorops nasuta]|uniref:hemicentin-1 isoform X2 n=1 Tax=Prorops nasuta TaxID=863751 RepID=UPI0034CD50FB